MVILRKMEPVKKVFRIFYKGITIFYHMGDWDYRFLPFKRAYADYGISSRVRHFQQKNCKLQQFFSEVSYCRSYHLPPPFLKQCTSFEVLFLFYKGGRRSTDRCAARSDDGVETSGSTAQSDVRERSEGNPSPDLNTNLDGNLYPVLEKIFTKQN